MSIFINTFLRIFAFFTALLAFFLLLLITLNFFSNEKNTSLLFNKKGDLNSTNKIAIIKLNGPILNEPSGYIDIDMFNNFEIIYLTRLKEILDELKLEKIKGLIISINSPGGTVSASYNLYNLLNEFKNNNKIEIFFHADELMASGAYWVSLSGSKIYANYGSLIGSIGVKGPDWIYFDTPISLSNGLLSSSVETKKGIRKFNNISGISKDLFDPFRPPTEKEILDLQNLTQNVYQDFVSAVSKNRSIEKDIIINEIGAMIFDNKTAIKNFLIDDTAELEIVIEKLAEHLSLKTYQIIEVKKSSTNYFKNFFNVILFSENYLNPINKKMNQKICNISKYELSTIFFRTDLLSNC